MVSNAPSPNFSFDKRYPSDLFVIPGYLPDSISAAAICAVFAKIGRGRFPQATAGLNFQDHNPMLTLLIGALAASISGRRPVVAQRKDSRHSRAPRDIFACIICKLAVPIVEWGVLNQETIDEITLEVENTVSADVAPEARDICEVYVKAQVPQIVQAIFDDIKETDTCAWFGIC
jgi:hypothetical protein